MLGLDRIIASFVYFFFDLLNNTSYAAAARSLNRLRQLPHVRHSRPHTKSILQAMKLYALLFRTSRS